MVGVDPDRAPPGVGYVIEEVDGHTRLVVTGPWRREIGDVLVREDVEGLVLNYARGFEPDPERGELDFLDRRYRLDRGTLDLTPIYRLRDTLTEVSIQAAPSAPLDLAELPGLSKIAGPWHVIGPTLGALRHLQEVVTWRFGEHDLTAFASHARLERVTIKDAPHLHSLNGLTQDHSLRYLEVRAARRLTDVAALARHCHSLIEVRFERCSAISSLEPFAALGELRFLEIGDCGELPSAVDLQGLDALEALYAWGSTRFADGDLSVLTGLLRLREVRMRNRRHYRPSLEELLTVLSSRD